MDTAAHLEGDHLLAVANAEDASAEFRGQDFGIDSRAARFVDAARAAGDDDAFTPSEFAGWDIAGLNLGVNTEVADFAGDQVTILTAGVQDGYLWCQILCYWQAKPPARLLPVVAREAPDDQLFRFVEQGLCFLHRIGGLGHFGIGLNSDLLGFLVAEASGVHFAL